MAVQTDEITPADKKLYALRDVTGTVASIPLIVGSILSKKLAEGSDTLVFDVKTGVGTFMRTEAESVELATALVEGARANGRKAAALVTDMNEPLGYAVGNANEVAEAIEILKGRLKLPIVDLCVEFAALMVALEKPMDLDRARELCRQNLENGAAYARFEAMVEAHGGSLAAFGEKLASPVFKFTLQANQSGFVGNIDAHVVAKVAFQLGAGRAQAGDRIDDLAGVTLQVSRGDKVAIGSPLATICSSRTPDLLERNAGELLEAFSIVSEKPQPKELIVWRSST
jgi:pyrimidine-nucleoside phosphorylase